MDRNAGGLVVAVVVIVAIFAVKNALFKVNDVDVNKAAEVAQKKQADDRAHRIAGNEPPFSLEDPKHDFSITFPSKPTSKDIVLVGLNVGFDKDWELEWLDDNRFSVHLRTTPTRVADDEVYVRGAARQKIDHENKIKAGKPEQWIIGDHREFLFQDKYPAAEFASTYKKFSHQEARSGRVLIVKVPGQLYYIQADGPPDYIAGPVTERFFTSFRYSPKEKPHKKS